MAVQQAVRLPLVLLLLLLLLWPFRGLQGCWMGPLGGGRRAIEPQFPRALWAGLSLSDEQVRAKVPAFCSLQLPIWARATGRQLWSGDNTLCVDKGHHTNIKWHQQGARLLGFLLSRFIGSVES